MRMFRAGVLLICVLGLNFSNAKSQLSDRIHEQLQFKYITIDEGLNNNRVRGLGQDNYGFIWIGTRFGISRFDGYNIKQYNNYYSDTTTAEYELTETKSIFCDSRNTLWASGNYGICYFDWSEDRFKQFLHKDLAISLASCMDMDEDKNGNLWFATNGGLLMFNAETNQLKLYSEADNDPKSPPRGNMDKIVISDENHVWYGYIRNGVGFLNQETGTFNHFLSSDDPESLAENRVERLYKDKEGNIWIGHNNNGVSKYSYNTGRFTRYYPEPGRKEAGRVRGIIEDGKGNFWFGTQAGLYIFDRNEETFKRYAYADHPISTLSHNSIQTMTIDNQEGLWIGTIAGGVSYTNLNSSGIVKYEYSRIPSEYYLNDKSVYSLAFDRNENIWVGTENGGLNFLDRETGKFEYFTEGSGDENAPRSNNIKDIFIDENDLVWFGTYKGGLSYYNPLTTKFRHYQRREDYPQGIEDESIFVIYPDQLDDNISWIGSTDRLYSFNEEEEVFIHILPETPGFNNTPAISRVYRICTNSENIMFIAGTRMLLLLDRNTNTFTPITSIEDINIDYVDFVFLDKYEYLWAGINTSFLVRYDIKADSFLVFDERKGLDKAQYSEGIDDSNGNIWLSSDNGLYKLENIIEQPDSFNIFHYDKSDNIQSLEFLYHSRAKSPSGEILFGGINGFNFFRPENVKPNPYVPNVVISKLVIRGEEVKDGEEVLGKILLKKPILETNNLKFHHKIKVFSFHFTAFHFVAPENNKFKYMLEGYDEDWQYTDANIRSATYSNIPRGSYVFKVDATNNNGKWSDDPFLINVRITPPYWKTAWFYIIIGLVLTFIIYSFIKRRESQLKEDKDLLESKIQKGAEELKSRKDEIEQQKLALEEKEKSEFEHNWTNEGMAKFSEILGKEKDNLEVLASKLISNIVEYVEASQGGIYFLNDTDGEEKYLELIASYAFNPEKVKFYIEEGLVGSCYKTKEKIEIDNLPDGYTKIESGLGDSQPGYLVLVPILLDKEVLGVIEITSFEKLAPYKTVFINKLGENIASIVFTAKANEKVKEMFSQSQIQAEELLAQEEEMKQNLEEMQATQEEANRREGDLLKEIEEREKALSETLKKKDKIIEKLKKANNKK